MLPNRRPACKQANGVAAQTFSGSLLPTAQEVVDRGQIGADELGYGVGRRLRLPEFVAVSDCARIRPRSSARLPSASR
jgi:hypothetical protein